MNTNAYVVTAALDGLRQKGLSALPPEAEFMPFNLSALRPTPKHSVARA
jgi:hypothetical protein